MHPFIKKCKRAVQWRIRALLNRARDPDEQFNKILSHLVSDENPVIFDVGAHNGESITRFRRLFPSCTIHSFEPDQQNFSILKKGYETKEGIVLNNVGVGGTKGTLTFHRNLKSNTSGFHAVNTQSQWAQNRAARHNVEPKDYTEKSYDVPIINLDSYVQEHNIPRIHLLKIDTQGHEDEVLKGAETTLQKGLIDIIETELIVGDAYTKSLQFYDLEKFLIPAGYRFYGIDKHDDLKTTPHLSFNVIYVHEKIFDTAKKIAA